MITKGDIKISNRMENLIKRIEKAPDFGYDDEEVALDKLLKKEGLRRIWNDSLRNPELIISKAEGWKEDKWSVKE